MKFKKIFLAILLFCLVNQSTAQILNEKIAISAMTDELLRNMQELELPGYPKPFYISYTLSSLSSVQITASLGSILGVNTTPLNNKGNIRLLIGDQKYTSEISYGAPTLGLELPVTTDYDMFRRGFWGASDMAYKVALGQYSNKMNHLQNNPRSSKTASVNDFELVKANSYFEPSPEPINIDINKWKQNLRELSAIFKQYPNIENSSVMFVVNNYTIYQATSEGLMTKTPNFHVALVATCQTTLTDGSTIVDKMNVLGLNLEDLDPIDKLKSKFTAFAESLISVANSDEIEEHYNGPVMFEGDASLLIFTTPLVKNNGLLAYRGKEGEQVEYLENRLEKKIIDDRITVKNYSKMKEYNGVKLFGSYDIDAEGIKPADELALIDKGIFKAQLNSRIPTVSAPRTTGSSRWTINTSSAYAITSPGTLHFEVNGGIKGESMKKELLKLAKKNKQDYAYIVRKISGTASLIYRVSVKTGEEKLVRNGKIDPVNINTLKKIAAISNDELVSNNISVFQTLVSYIYPSSVILDNIDINKVTSNNTRIKNAVEFPLRRN